LALIAPKRASKKSQIRTSLTHKNQRIIFDSLVLSDKTDPSVSRDTEGSIFYEHNNFFFNT
jgi:hypothetical protein